MPWNRTSATSDNVYRRALLTCLALVLTLGAIPAAAWAFPVIAPHAQETAPATMPGQVVAQGITRLPRGDIAWTVRRLDVSGAEGVAVESFPVGFALADAGTVAVLDADGGVLSLLGAGEAALLPDGRDGALATRAEETASVIEIALVANRDIAGGEIPGSVVGNPFPAPDGGAFDLELSQAMLNDGEQATIPVSRSGAPVLYLQLAGTVQLQAGGGQPVELAAGQFALLAGEVSVSNASGEPATFSVAAIGEATSARDADAEGTPRARADREDRQRARDGAQSAQGGDAPRAGGGREGRTPRARGGGRGGGGGGGRGGQTQQPQTPGGAPGTGTGTTPPPDGTAGTPPAEATVPATQPTVPTGDGTPPVDATVPPTGETPTAEPTGTIPAEETPAGEPTAPADPTAAVVPTNPPVPAVPTPMVPTVPAEETVGAESMPVEEAPVEEAPVEEAPPAEPTPAP